MSSQSLLKISTTNLVNLTCASGDLSFGTFAPSPRPTDAIRVHRMIQQEYGDKCESEVTLLCRIGQDELALTPGHIEQNEELVLEISGRIDCLITELQTTIIEEIKTVSGDPRKIGENDNPTHWAQVRCYAYMFALKQNIESIVIRLAYIQIDTYKIQRFERTENLDELREFFFGIVRTYLSWASSIRDWKERRNSTIRTLSFPFGNFRPGQRDFSAMVYRAIRDRATLFAQAPTGTGKTMAVLFPSVKAMGENKGEKIFYLTAKGVTSILAEKAIDSMRSAGLEIRSVTLTAKDKICFAPEAACDPELCPFAKNYYDRREDALSESLQQSRFSREAIESLAQKHTLCPFELSLDLSLWSDIIICDYNYVFDPRVYLRRFFADEDGDYVFLIDEAHNLVDRSREMFSATLTSAHFRGVRRQISRKLPDLSKSLTKVLSSMKSLGADEGEISTLRHAPADLAKKLRSFARLAEIHLASGQKFAARKQLLELYFDTLFFIRVSEEFNECYVTTIAATGNELSVKLFCLDASGFLAEALKRGISATFFSATLTPLPYFRSVLGGSDAAKLIRIGSPFPPQNFCVLVDTGTQTLYKERERTGPSVAMAINELVKKREGNYLVFFPSYAYLQAVLKLFTTLSGNMPEIITQRPDMDERERRDFLENFSAARTGTLVGFAVMGGIFGEGIDLAGDCLVGAVVVGVGLPQICNERELLKEYYQMRYNSGFEYAYTYSGINKVLQAAGRVIRSENDRGVLLLIDQRFSRHPYKHLLPPEWIMHRGAHNSDTIHRIITEFWSDTSISQEK